MAQLSLSHTSFAERAISPHIELGAYEALWERKNASFKTIAEMFASSPNSVPSDFVPAGIAQDYAKSVHNKLKDVGVTQYGVRVHGAGDYPERLRDAEHPIELLYYQGWWELVNSPRTIAIVGTRSPSEDGLLRTRKLIRSLLADNFTIVSGLAKGVDSAAHNTTIKEGGRTIAVLGTPLSRAYPSENAELQKEIARNHLVISQVPVMRYEHPTNPVANRHFFPSRNITMSALTDATVIIEAGETSGTLIQAKAALMQRRKLFILDSCFKNPQLTWPHKYAEMGAIRVTEYNDIRKHLIPDAADSNR